MSENGGGSGRIYATIAALAAMAGGGAAVLRPVQYQLEILTKTLERVEQQLSGHERLLMHDGAKLVHDKTEDRLDKLESIVSEAQLKIIRTQYISRELEQLEKRLSEIQGER